MASASVCFCVCVCVMNARAFVLTPGLSWSVHGDLYGSVVCGHLWRVGEYRDCQREALACGDIKQTSNDVPSARTMTRFHGRAILQSQVWL